ncbi:MAG: PIN domain-containing protein [Nitrospinae bacterium]|nr:PIN domain-containing protein [Nitrospinota bacterium]MBI3815618.1 PIN domain-containing protein [Nitrospinota bacterium]
MAKVRLLVDSDIIIDYLKGIKQAQELFRSTEIILYCSILSKKELLSKPGLNTSERKKIIRLLNRLKVLKVDEDILAKYTLLVNQYGENHDFFADYIIAATAWAK